MIYGTSYGVCKRVVTEYRKLAEKNFSDNAGCARFGDSIRKLEEELERVADSNEVSVEVADDMTVKEKSPKVRKYVYPDLSEVAVDDIGETKQATADVSTNLISFNDGSYKKIRFTDYKHSQWIHFTRDTGKAVRVNPRNVNYIEEV